MLFITRFFICSAVCCAMLFLTAGISLAKEKAEDKAEKQVENQAEKEKQTENETENQGQEDLSLATEAKLSAENFNDLSEVIRLCESAMEKGLDAENTQFAKQLLAATLAQRAQIAAKMIFAGPGLDPKWADYRRLALVDLEKAVKLVPDEPEALVLIAKLNFLPGGDAKKAADALDRAVAVKDADTRIRASALLLRAGSHKDAEKRLADLNEALRIEPNMVEALRARGFHYARENKSEEALRDLEAADKLEPDHPPTIEALALVLSQLKEFDPALEHLDKLQKLRPNMITPLLFKARIYAVRSNLDEALECLNRALELQPGSLDVMLLRASLLDEMKQPQKALADVDRVLELKPDDEKARRLRAMLLVKAGKIKEVAAELRAILKSTPDDLNLQMQLGILYTMMQKPSKAIRVYSDVLAKDPENSDALIARAGVFLTIGKHAESIADYEKAQKLGAEDSGMLNNFAWVLATSPDDKLRNGKRALELAKKACEMTDYKQAHILSTLAAAYAESGDFKSAVEWSKKAFELGQKTADKDIQESLEKELKSFASGKPWRERLSEKDLKPFKIEAETPPKPEATPKPETPIKPETPKKDDDAKSNDEKNDTIPE